MTKAELVKGLSEGMEITKKEAEAMVGHVDTIIEFLAGQGYEKTKVGKFVTVSKIHKEEKKGIAMGKEYIVPEHDELVIKRTSLLKSI
ncbi:HU family DNA-binding protein [Clostridium perfringens]|nr:HU family DNA-binding protein [Clostridium perfringens]